MEIEDRKRHNFGICTKKRDPKLPKAGLKTTKKEEKALASRHRSPGTEEHYSNHQKLTRSVHEDQGNNLLKQVNHAPT